MRAEADSTVVVAGANGFIGSHLARGLARRGHRVIALVRRGADCERLQSWPTDDRCALERTDYSPDHLRALFKRAAGGAFINAIGYGLDAKQRDLELAFQTNIRIALDLAAAAAAYGCDTIHLGSAYEYQISGSPLDEYAPISPESFYGITKASASLLMRLQADELGQRLLILRPFSIYGPGETAAKLIPAVIQACRAKRPINLSNGSKARDYTYIDDMVDAVARVLAADTDWPEVANIGSGRPMRLRYMVERICAITGADPELARWGELPARKGDPSFLVADVSLMHDLFGWRATTSFEDGLRSTMALMPAPADGQELIT